MASRVVVVDDHPDSARAACLLLGLFGHECHAVFSGSEAFDEIERFAPEIAILDIGLPEISGYEIARALRRRFGATIYLIALTGWGQAEDRARAFAAGFDAHLVKPADGAMLQQAIATAVRSRA